MSNVISAPGAEDVVMSNGMTSVVLSVLLLSGSDLARSDHEVATMAWLAEHDQATVGLGVVGFDVADLGWTREDFDRQKQFLLQVIDGAMAGHRWDTLSYQPNADDVRQYLGEFRELVAPGMRSTSTACAATPPSAA